MNPNGILGLLRGASLKVQMRHPARDPKPDALPRDLEEVLGPWRTMVAYHWRAMPTLHRFVLATLATNPRLLWRAMTEIAKKDRWTGSEELPPIHGQLARCEVRIPDDSLAYLNDIRFHAGRAEVLARAAGVRVARATPDLIDSHAHIPIGPVELESGPLRRIGLLFQAHVSTADGLFSPTASLLAATTAAVALVDLFREVDDSVAIIGASLSDEPWMFGSADNEATLAV